MTNPRPGLGDLPGLIEGSACGYQSDCTMTHERRKSANVLGRIIHRDSPDSSRINTFVVASSVFWLFRRVAWEGTNVIGLPKGLARPRNSRARRWGAQVWART